MNNVNNETDQFIYGYFKKDYLSGSEITATVALALSTIHSIWVIKY